MMDRFTKVAILVTIIVILSNAVLVYFNIEFYKIPKSDLLGGIIFKLLSIIIFVTLLILKIVFKKAVNYIFFCFFTSIFISSILAMIGFFIQDSFNKLTPSQIVFKTNIWIPIGANILWTLMFVFIFLNLKSVKGDEQHYFIQKNKINVRLNLFKHGLIFWIFTLLMIINLFFIVKMGNITDLFASLSGFSSLIYILACITALFTITKQLFSLYILSTCLFSYLIFQSIIPTLVNFLLIGSHMQLAQKILFMCFQLISMSFIVVVTLQAISHYKKIKHKEEVNSI